MVGTYGHEKVDLENSKTLFESSWEAKVERLNSQQIVVTGFSC